MKCIAATILSLLLVTGLHAQWKQDDIYTPFVMYKERTKLDQNLRENVIRKTFSLPLDSNTAYKYETACWAITQFMVKTEEVENGFTKMIRFYDRLDADARRSILEAIYGNDRYAFVAPIDSISQKEEDPALFAMAAVYLSRASIRHNADLLVRMAEHFPAFDSTDILTELQYYLNHHAADIKNATPSIADLFRFNTGRKIIYSFQRWNRDYPGLAIVQTADGGFVRHPDGRLMVFQQLARSGSDLPYFITNGSTPQGVYSIRGVGVSHNNLIGPTPNIQMLLPFEGKWENYFQLDSTAKWDSSQSTLAAYGSLWPASWRKYRPALEAYYAGKLGRTEIIAHGTTIDPEYFQDKPFYPLTPTLGCLCAREQWNITTGRPTLSEQLGLVNAFLSTRGSKGFLFVINLDDQQKPVTREELEAIIKKSGLR